MKDRFEIKLELTGTLYAYGQEAAEHMMALELAKMVCNLGLWYKNVKVQVEKVND